MNRKNFYNINKSGKNAFTLAEVLITLGIIGVVAALTLPTLIANYTNQKNVELLKKFYSSFSQALLKASIDAGCDGDMDCYYSAIGVTDNNNNDDRTKKAYDSLSKQLVNIKKCDNPVGTGLRTNTCSDYKWNKNYDGSAVDANFPYNFVTSDGMYVAYFATQYSINNGWTSVDVNGPKKPNREGRDIFAFWLFENSKILPPVDFGNCTDTDKYGQSCAARIMRNNWKIDY